VLKKPVSARPGIQRNPVHASITSSQISTLVETFYDEIRLDARLGPIFETHVSDWEAHLKRMKGFWRSVLLHTGEYKGKPVPTHVAILEIESEDFHVWLKIFRAITRRCFNPEAVPLVIEKAERIAKSLWLAKFATPFTNTPENF